MAEETQDGQKTLVAFVVGLLIGGMLVWAFSGPSAAAPDKATDKETVEVEMGSESDTEDTTTDTDAAATKPAAVLTVGDGNIVINDQPAGMSVVMETATYPVSEGWIGVREFNNDNLGFIKGVVRFSESQGLVPSDIILQQPTVAGKKYAVVIFTEDGDFDFNLSGDVQIDTIFDTFTAQ